MSAKIPSGWRALRDREPMDQGDLWLLGEDEEPVRSQFWGKQWEEGGITVIRRLPAAAPQRAPEEVAARVCLAWSALYDCGATYGAANSIEELCLNPNDESLRLAGIELLKWAADGADPETAKALEAAAGEMSK